MSRPHAPSLSWRQRLISSIVHMGKALGYSTRGLAAGMRLCLSFRQEVLVLVILIGVLACTGKEPGQWLLCLGVWTLVMVTELLNTALEEALNLITMEYSEQVRDAKDMASAAVFLLLILNAVLWVYVFWGDLARLWGGIG